MKPAVLLAFVGLISCEAPESTAEDFAADPEEAATVVAACDAGRASDDCEPARRGLAQARREARMRTYERAF